MANQRQAASKRLRMSERAEQQLGIHFPGYPETELWRRKSNDGFTTIPRTMPLVMQAIDDLSKGQPAGHTLFCLWARSPDHPLVTVENPATFASEAGFEGERAVDTWRRRMKQLRELKFVDTRKGPSGEFHYVLLRPSAPQVSTKTHPEGGKHEPAPKLRRQGSGTEAARTVPLETTEQGSSR